MPGWELSRADYCQHSPHYPVHNPHNPHAPSPGLQRSRKHYSRPPQRVKPTLTHAILHEPRALLRPLEHRLLERLDAGPTTALVRGAQVLILRVVGSVGIGAVSGLLMFMQRLERCLGLECCSEQLLGFGGQLGGGIRYGRCRGLIGSGGRGSGAGR